MSVIAGAMALFASSALAGTTLQWDINAAAGIQGGSGVWNTSLSNWNDGATRIGWNSLRADTALFSGTPGGTISLNSSLSAASVEFTAPGYTITGSSTLTLSTGLINAEADATIVAPLSTPAGLTKSGAGLLSLQGSNTFHGNLSIQGGTLSVTAETQLGASTNFIELADGAFRYANTSQLTLSASRKIVVDAAGGQIDLPNGKLNLLSAGQLTGSGTLTKIGAQTLTISAANSNFTGSLEVAAGAVVLQNAAAINGQPLFISGGTLQLRIDQPSDFHSDLTINGDGTLDVDHLTVPGMVGGAITLGNLSLLQGKSLAAVGANRNYVAVAAADLSGALRITNTALRINGPFTGAGPVTFGVNAQLPEQFTSGLIFANGLSQTITNAFSGDPTAASNLTVGVGSGTGVTYNSVWNGGGDAATSTLVLHDGGHFVLGPSAHLNTLTSDLITARPFLVIGNGTDNIVELDPASIADHTAAGTIPDGFAGLEIRDATLITHATQSLPIVNRKDGAGAIQRAGSIAFSGALGPAWNVTTADQQYDGGVTLNSSTTLLTEKNLTHTGSASGKLDGQFQIPVAGAVLTKQGPGWLNLSGSQGYAAGSKMVIQAGGVRFNTDPGAGWYAGNYSREANGDVSIAPAPNGTLTVAAGGAAVEFAAPVSRLDRLELSSGGAATVTTSVGATPRTLITHSLEITAGGQLDLGNNQLIINYDGASPLNDIAASIRTGFNPGGAHWQGDGIISQLAASNTFMGIGFAEASDALKLSGNATALFGGAAVDATSLLVRFTRLGDADLDGVVTFADFQRLERGLGQSGQTWSGGDFNYDGKVDSTDFKLLYDNFGKTADLPAAAQSLPEPSPLTLMALAALLLKRRRHPTRT